MTEKVKYIGELLVKIGRETGAVCTAEVVLDRGDLFAQMTKRDFDVHKNIVTLSVGNNGSSMSLDSVPTSVNALGSPRVMTFNEQIGVFNSIRRG